MLFIYMLYKVVLTFESVDETLINRDHLNYLSNFFKLMFIMLYKVVRSSLLIKSLKCDQLSYAVKYREVFSE